MREGISEMSVIEIGDKTLYTSAGIEGSEWVREPVKGFKTHDAPQMKSGLSVGQDGRGASVKGSLGYMTSVANSMYKSATDVFLTSSCSSMANGLSVMEGEGWRRAISLFSARKLSKDTWVIHEDEYLVPSVYEGEVDK